MLVFDAHCDTISRIFENGENLYTNTGRVDIIRMKKYKRYIQFFAIWLDQSYSTQYLQKCIQMIDKFFVEMEQNAQHICFVSNFSDTMKALRNNKIAAFLSLEGGEALMGDLSILRALYRLGVRCIGLTWNNNNQLCDGIDQPDGKGLTPLGFDVIAEMNKLGIIIDVSHLSERGFWDVCSKTKKPFIASHSNAKDICKHRRNLTREQFEAIRDKGGVAGINLFPFFLSDSGVADMADVIAHIEYFMGLGGENSICLGSDFDGISSVPSNISGIENFEDIFNQLLKMNYSQLQVEKIAGKNLLRVIQEIL